MNLSTEEVVNMNTDEDGDKKNNWNMMELDVQQEIEKKNKWGNVKPNSKIFGPFSKI